MNSQNPKTPGVYINEINAFPNSVIGVETAVPAFIGYTPQASLGGKSYTNIVQKIASFAEFQEIYCLPNPPSPADPTKQYCPEYYFVKEKKQPENGDFIRIGNDYYSIVPDPNTIYYLYNSIQLFFQNGGGNAYIVSVGSYGQASGSPMSAGDQIVNANVKLNDLLGGVKLLSNEMEPTMYICPEATLLSVENNSTLMQEMLLQCTEMQTAMCIFDIIGARNPDPILYTNDIQTFRDNTGSVGLKYGTAYYPFVGTTIMQREEMDYTNLFGGDIKQLEALLNPESEPNPRVEAIFKNLETYRVSQNEAALRVASPVYNLMMNSILEIANILPPSGGMAGVITTIDNQSGVWTSPANTSMVSVVSLPIRINESQQGDLNLDAVTGKSINAIRFFNGLGILIWGARTLDGNSMDWKYISVRRTITFLEQSCKLAAHAYVFEPNDKNTWEAVKAMIASFLNDVWKQGGLQGATADDAFRVECGLGSTMTSEDILNGFMRVSVKVAVVRPAEYIIIEFMQEMAKS